MNAEATERARIGLIVPSSNRMAEPHFWRYAPAGVNTYTTRLRMTGRHRMKLAKLLPDIAGAAQMLADAGCDPVVFHCTANSMAEGVAAEQEIVETIAAATGRRATTTASATTAALCALGARRIALISPYVRATHEHEIDFLTEAGLAVVAERNLGLTGSDDYCAVTPAEWVSIAAAVMTDDAEACFISCANIRAIEALEAIESAVGRAVLTSNQVVLWHALRLAGIDDAPAGLGRLMRETAPALAARRVDIRESRSGGPA